MRENEIENLFTHSLKHGKIFSLAVFITKKILQRRRFQNVNYGWNYYPESLKNIIKPCLEKKINRNWNFPHQKNSKTADALYCPEHIQLAGSILHLDDGKVPFEKKFDDSEDEEALHRWNWLLTLQSATSTEHQAALSHWGINQMRHWKESFAGEADRVENHNTPRWESYTVGERAANTVLFFSMTGICPPDDILELLDTFTHFLLPRMEFKGHLTGNHVFNNARALYLVAQATGTEWLRDIATHIIFKKLDELTDPNGFMREGSSHYQFLFTRWVMDIKKIADLTGDKTLSDFLQPRLEQLQMACRFFLVNHPADLSVTLPCFGDISPDFTPEWLVKHLQNHLLQNTLPQKGLAITQPPFAEKSSAGWHRFEHGLHTMLLRADHSLIPEHVGHHHNDFYHFCHFWDGIPILVDLGRLNYRMDDPCGVFGITPMAHNSVLLDGCGIAPHLWHRYPLWYSQAENKVIHNKNDGHMVVSLSSTGFFRLKGNPCLKRSLTLSNEKLEIADHFTGKGQHDFEIWLHFDPHIKVAQQSEMVFILESTGKKWVLQIEQSVKTTFEIFYDHPNGPGRHVGQYGKRTPCYSLKISGRFHGQVIVKTILHSHQ